MFTFKASSVWDPEYLYDYLELRKKIDGHNFALLEPLSAIKVASTVSASVTDVFSTSVLQSMFCLFYAI